MKKINFEKKIILTAVLITFIPLVLSYIVFLQDKLSSNENRIKMNLKTTAVNMSQSNLIQEKLYKRENDGSIQEYTKKFINDLGDIDLIVIGDMTGEKYSHLDETQVGKKYVNNDNKEVIEKGTSYYSTMEGSMGYTLRRFEPIMYDGKQVGFVMVGKYSDDISLTTRKITLTYTFLLILSLSIAIVIHKSLARKVKKAMLGMEPEEITMLYNQKNIIINSVKDGIIALDKENKITDINNNCYRLFEDFSPVKTIDKLWSYIEAKKPFTMKEMIIQGKRIFVTLNPIIEEKNYYGTVITLIDREDINKVAKEITGIDEVVKNLRANVHEFKNNLHVIVGLLQLKEYDETIKYIRKIQQVQENNTVKFLNIEDYYVRALMLSRELVAKERNIEFVITKDSFLYGKHNFIDSYDLVTILGNLIENAFEACTIGEKDRNKVEVSLWEDDDIIKIIVKDNGKAIDKEIKEKIFVEGESTKGQGRGTGLYLVKSRVELYNGDIKIDEDKDGKIFIITILKGE
ncbi:MULTISPECIES: ATP-binding protein [Clostridium]|uniref:histidine kinase n=1 Tax=Clostridium cibarium TaxID=2762247 RepID=A0ABR8PVK0_9CLOT|nr:MULTISPECIES: ATP-binding protein [Clostridium]MBD7912180.1 GHKL domain-containing protein [Clostridium cibarium]